MRNKAKRTLSLFLVLCLLVSLFAGLTVTAAAASQTVTVQITDKAGETKTLATWEYDEVNTTYKDQATGTELAIVKDFTIAENLKGSVNGASYDFSEIGMLAYTGANKKPNDCRAWAVAKKGILLEDVYTYAGALLDGENGAALLKSDDVTLTMGDGSAKTNTYTYAAYWGQTKYYYPKWMEKSQNAGTVAAEEQEGGQPVPTVLAILGYHGTGALPAWDSLTPDAEKAPRAMQGQQQDGADKTTDANLGFNSVSNITLISFSLDKTFEEAGIGGSGDQPAPTTWDGATIGSAADFEAFAAAVNGGDDFSGKTVTLSGNVDLSAVADWTPVGGKDHPFAGTFDGAGKAITGLTITDITGGYHGLFGYVTGTVKNFTLAGSIESNKGVDFVGSVAGFNAGTITGVTSSVTINAGSAYNVGGIAGLSTSGLWVDANQNDKVIEIPGATGLIENCANTGAITGIQKVGGIVGENAGTVNACYNTGKVDGTNNSSKNGIGGIAGRNGNNNTAKEVGVISNCYNTGAVGRSGQKWTGGIAGFNNSLSGIKNCYNIGEIVSTTGYSNPIAGNQEGSSNTVNNYSLEGLKSTGSSVAERGTVKTADEMKSADFVTALCGDGRAFVAKADDYPILRWQTGTDTAAVTGLKIVSDPAKLNYAEGEFFDTTGLKIVKEWSDGTTEAFEDYTVSTTDAITENCTVTISARYGEFSVSKDYNVTVITVTGIEIGGNPTTAYVEGQKFKTSGMVVEAVYSDGSRRTLPLSDYTVEPSGALTPSDTRVTVSYTPAEGGTAFTAELAIAVEERVLQSIEVSDEPDDLYYAADEALDLTGMEIRAKFNDKAWAVEINPATEDNPDGYTWALGADNKTVTITYTFKNVTKTAEFTITRSGSNTPALTDGAYQLGSSADLVWFGKKVNDAKKTALNAALTADIAVPDDWTPLYAFKGVFDGKGHKLTFSMTAARDYSGFFNALEGTVKNLTMDGTVLAAITTGWSKQNVGVFANTASKGAVFENCANLASLTVNAGEGQDTVSNVGAFIGRTMSGGVKLSNCINKGSISGNIKDAGGIVGQIYFSGVEIAGCANTGSISSTAEGGSGFGGIVGNVDDSCTLSNCYNTGAVMGEDGVGGIVGTTASGTMTIQNSYNVGALTGTTAGELVGSITANARVTLSNAYYLEGGKAYSAAEGITVTAENTAGKTDAELKSAGFAALLGSAFAADSTALNGGYPILTWQVPSTPVRPDPDPDPDPTPGGDVAAAVWDGRSIDLTWYDPAATTLYISTPAQLAGLAAIVNGIYNAEIDTFAGDKSYIVDNTADSGGTGGNNMATSAYHYGADNFAGKTVYLTADIDMGTANYMPIGGQYLMTKNDSTTRIDASFCGVFDGQGHSVTLHTDRHCGNGNFGDGQSVGLIGRLGVHDNEEAQKPTGAAVRSVAVYGSVYANRCVGGVVGKTGRGTDTVIENCANFASVKGTDSKGVGGICGAAWNGVTIRSCYNAGAVETTYSTGMTGGIAGSSEATIANCYNVGTITAPAGNRTAAIASSNGGDSYENCYWLSGSADMGVYNKTLDSVMEKTAEELKNAGMPALLGSAFAADSGNINSGYPVLSWQASDSPVQPGGSTENPGTAAETELPFTDVADHWAVEAIRYAYENKLFQGVSDTEFAPDATMTRGMLVTVLHRLAGEPEAKDAGFADVAADSWYAAAVAWAAENGIVLGYGASFGPNDLVTREQMTAILLRYAVWKQYDTTAGGMALREYADYAEISDWAAAALEWANAEGLILGRTETTIVPQGDATRAEVATILMRFIEKFAAK